MSAPVAPSLQAVTEHLRSLRGLPIFDIPLRDPSGELVGNNGDVLIRLGAQQLYEEAGLTFVQSPDDAELLLIGGNGGMLEKYRTIPDLFCAYWARYPDKPLLMMPSTFYYPTTSPTAGLPARTADVTLFCRERKSYEHLTQQHHLPDCCRVLLSHDTAFALSGTPHVTRYQGQPGRHILMVERDDSEHPGRFAAQSATARRSWQSYIPVWMKKPLYPVRAYLAGRRSSEFRRRCEEILWREHPELTRHPRLVRDISRREYGTFEDFCQAIAAAAVVLTMRLHVGIFAALLGKPTYIFGGPYHKIRAIYEHSLSGFSCAKYVPWGESEAASKVADLTAERDW
jgi:exopolysaccharide biosynthesis predicted pyruvyltransferase EpsI